MNSTGKKSAFTLIELLVVIAIIGILVAIILPSVGRIRRNAELARANSEVRQIEGAIMAYNTQYGKLPIPDRAQGCADASFCVGGTYFSYDNNLPFGSRDVIRVLAMIENIGHSHNIRLKAGGYASGKDRIVDMNPRRIVFLEAKQHGRIEEEYAGYYPDPWREDYHMALDADYDGKISFFSGQYGTVSRRAIVYSAGPFPSEFDAIYQNAYYRDNLILPYDVAGNPLNLNHDELKCVGSVVASHF